MTNPGGSLRMHVNSVVMALHRAKDDGQGCTKSIKLNNTETRNFL